jgi:spermidine/putrescine transport system substrate-binding protein
MGLVMLARGVDLATASVDDVEETVESLRSQAAGGRFAGFYGNDYLAALESGDLAATMAWSGDVLQAQLDNPYLKFVLPEEGLMIWSDNLLIPAASEAAGAATALVDYYYQPEVAARVAAWVNYICPVQGAQAAMEELDPELAASPLIFPDATTLDRSHQFPSLPTGEDERLRAAFADVAASVG